MTPERKQDLTKAMHAAGMVAGVMQMFSHLMALAVAEDDESGLRYAIANNGLAEVESLMQMVTEVCMEGA